MKPRFTQNPEALTARMPWKINHLPTQKPDSLNQQCFETGVGITEAQRVELNVETSEFRGSAERHLVPFEKWAVRPRP